MEKDRKALLKAKIDKLKQEKTKEQAGTPPVEPKAAPEKQLKPKKDKRKDNTDEDREEIVRGIEKDTTEPTNKSEFEKEVLMRPNDTELWVKYITFVYENQVKPIYQGLGRS